MKNFKSLCFEKTSTIKEDEKENLKEDLKEELKVKETRDVKNNTNNLENKDQPLVEKKVSKTQGLNLKNLSFSPNNDLLKKDEERHLRLNLNNLDDNGDVSIEDNNDSDEVVY